MQAGRCCGKCAYFEAATKRPRKGFRVRYGCCRRFPPMVPNVWNLRPGNQYVPAGFLSPEVHSQEWCGEFKADG